MCISCVFDDILEWYEWELEIYVFMLILGKFYSFGKKVV